MVSFVLPEELRMLRESLRRYVDAEMIPVEMDSVDGDEFRADYKERFQQEHKRHGRTKSLQGTRSWAVQGRRSSKKM